MERAVERRGDVPFQTLQHLVAERHATVAVNTVTVTAPLRFIGRNADAGVAFLDHGPWPRLSCIFV